MSVRSRKFLVALALFLGLCFCGGAQAADRWKDSLWLPEGVSSYSKDIDALFYGILILTGVVFIATEGLLLIFMVKYRKKEGERSFYTHGNHKLEMIWTITPAITLIVIALIQARTWNQIKDGKNFPDHNKPINEYVHVQLFAEQFDWHFRYPAVVDKKDKDGKPVLKDGKPEKEYRYGVPGSFTASKRLVVPKGKPVIVEMTSKDVIHSFFLPYMRLKQDVVPGMIIRCWFDASKTTTEMRQDRPRMVLTDPHKNPVDKEWDYPIVCAELCGIQHYQMAGTVEVMEPAEYETWLKYKRDTFDSQSKLLQDKPELQDEEQKTFKAYWQVDPVTGLRRYGDEYDNPRAQPDIMKLSEKKAEHK